MGMEKFTQTDTCTMPKNSTTVTSHMYTFIQLSVTKMRNLCKPASAHSRRKLFSIKCQLCTTTSIQVKTFISLKVLLVCGIDSKRIYSTMVLICTTYKNLRRVDFVSYIHSRFCFQSSTNLILYVIMCGARCYSFSFCYFGLLFHSVSPFTIIYEFVRCS